MTRLRTRRGLALFRIPPRFLTVLARYRPAEIVVFENRFEKKRLHLIVFYDEDFRRALRLRIYLKSRIVSNLVTSQKKSGAIMKSRRTSNA
jgi:hypothetical protein